MIKFTCERRIAQGKYTPYHCDEKVKAAQHREAEVYSIYTQMGKNNKGCGVVCGLSICYSPKKKHAVMVKVHQRTLFALVRNTAPLKWSFSQHTEPQLLQTV